MSCCCSPLGAPAGGGSAPLLMVNTGLYNFRTFGVPDAYVRMNAIAVALHFLQPAPDWEFRTDGELVYHGATKTFQIVGTATLHTEDDVDTVAIAGCGFDYQGDLLGQPVRDGLAGGAGCAQCTSDPSDGAGEITAGFGKLVTLNPEDSLFFVGGSVTGGFCLVRMAYAQFFEVG